MYLFSRCTVTWKQFVNSKINVTTLLQEANAQLGAACPSPTSQNLVEFFMLTATWCLKPADDKSFEIAVDS